MCFFFFKQKTAYEMRISDWSSDVCSSDLQDGTDVVRQGQGEGHQPSPSSGSWSLTTSSPSTTRAGSTSLRSPAITKPHRPSASPSFSGFTAMARLSFTVPRLVTWIVLLRLTSFIPPTIGTTASSPRSGALYPHRYIFV